MMFVSYTDCSGSDLDLSSSSFFEKFIAAGNLFKLLFSGFSPRMQFSYAVRFSTYTDVEDLGHVSFYYLKGLNPKQHFPKESPTHHATVPSRNVVFQLCF